MKHLILTFALLQSLLGFTSPAAAQEPAPQPHVNASQGPEDVFTEAWLVVRSAFYDSTFHGVDWDATRDQLLARARAARNRSELSLVINEALARLHASHTHHYTQDQREYYELLDIFWPEGVPERKNSAIIPGPAHYIGIGLAAKTIDEHTFASDVYSGGPADKAGILPGDELLGVEDGPWGDVAPFRGRENLPTTVQIQRTRDASSRQDVSVTPIDIHPRELFLSSIKEGARFIERDGVKVGYVRIRSYGHLSYHDALKDLMRDKFAPAGVPLVIDLRGGWGGASPAYMDIFNPTAPRLSFVNRAGETTTVEPTWSRPVVMLIDSDTRSGKEVLAYAFKKHHVGTLVGEKTAGAVLGGTVRPLADGSVLYLAMYNVLVDGDALESIGVEPDSEVHRNLPYAAGGDPQLDAAVYAALTTKPSKPTATP